MYLSRLSLQGFKTFAQKTELVFEPDADGRRGVTAVVGPNGSGKSNVADALRWVMGEQSLKLLRGKKSEDVIFSGSEKRSRSGFAEVSMTIQNDDKPEIGLAEIVVTRRLYRDGQSEYEINRQAARLQDVTMLLSQCGVGQRSYSVIGQGMIDHVLIATPAERREFFDEAFGLRPFQLKRKSALENITSARQNVTQTDLVLRELGPRVASLERQVKRLQERGALEDELRRAEGAYYGHGWQDVVRALRTATDRLELVKATQGKREEEVAIMERKFGEMEQATPTHEGFQELRKTLNDLSSKRNALRERQMQLETKRAVAAVRAEKPWSPLPLSRIIQTIDALHETHDALDRVLSSDHPDIGEARTLVKTARETGSDLLGKLQRPAPEPDQIVEVDPEIEREAQEIVDAMTEITKRIADAEARIEAWNAQEQDERKHIFALQHELNQKRQLAHRAAQETSEIAVQVARLETRRDTLLAEIRERAPHLEADLETLGSQHGEPSSADLPARIQRLRSQLEWIGGIDPEAVKEYESLRERFAFLTEQANDARETIVSLETIISELDATIRERGEKAFHRLDREFSVFFKKLFQGGDAKLVEIQPEKDADESTDAEGEVGMIQKKSAGIEIEATPPGKRRTSIGLLSGGERALTSIALICAIMATNPSPFVVLDEVDAALDESNAAKFADIISGLASQTQCVLITHNRATMSQASVLYGVTMGEDGASRLLSVKLEDLEKLKQASKTG